MVVLTDFFLTFFPVVFSESTTGSIKKIFPVIATTLLMPITLYLILMTIQRNHIMVWTVFSPKIFYEFFQCNLFYVIFLIVNCFI